MDDTSQEAFLSSGTDLMGRSVLYWRFLGSDILAALIAQVLSARGLTESVSSTLEMLTFESLFQGD